MLRGSNCNLRTLSTRALLRIDGELAAPMVEKLASAAYSFQSLISQKMIVRIQGQSALPYWSTGSILVSRRMTQSLTVVLDCIRPNST